MSDSKEEIDWGTTTGSIWESEGRLDGELQVRVGNKKVVIASARADDRDSVIQQWLESLQQSYLIEDKSLRFKKRVVQSIAEAIELLMEELGEREIWDE